MSELYQYILFNLYKLDKESVHRLLLDLRLIHCAQFLKTKFNDKRTIEQLVILIKDEYSLT